MNPGDGRNNIIYQISFRESTTLENITPDIQGLDFPIPASQMLEGGREHGKTNKFHENEPTVTFHFLWNEFLVRNNTTWATWKVGMRSHEILGGSIVGKEDKYIFLNLFF